MTDPKQPAFESWAVIELFGHQRIAGMVTEQQIAGTNFLRVDVPEQPAEPPNRWGHARPAVPAYSRMFGAGAIYAINPCSEETARRAASEFRARPAIPFDITAETPLLTGDDIVDADFDPDAQDDDEDDA